MMWKLVYNHYNIKQEIVNGKEQALEAANLTLRRFPYTTVDFHKFVGNETKYIESYEMEIKDDELKGLKKIELYK